MKNAESNRTKSTKKNLKNDKNDDKNVKNVKAKNAGNNKVKSTKNRKDTKSTNNNIQSIQNKIQQAIQETDIKSLIPKIAPYAIIFITAYFAAEQISDSILPYPSLYISLIATLIGAGMLYVKRLDKKKYRKGAQ